MAKFHTVFDGKLGMLEGTKHLEVDETVSPVRLPLRKILIASKDPLKQELERLVQLGVIVKETDPTDWVSSIVVPTKANGKMRLCIDPQPLNKALKRPQYPLHLLDEALPQLTSTKVFSVCNVENGFWHLTLDETSSKLTTFNTPFGRFRWTRLPFGVSPAPE